MESKKVGKVTKKERDEIQDLHIKKTGLQELVKTLATSKLENIDNSEFYNKLIKDMGLVTSKFQKWWENKSKKYNWEFDPEGNWSIDFESCDIFLNKKWIS